MNLKLTSLLSVLFFLTASFSHITYAESKADIQSKVSVCLSCHGSNGNSQIPGNPSLAGQPAMYIRAQLQNFQSGKRSNPIMKNMTANLSKQDIKDFSIYFSKLKSEGAGTNAPSLVTKGQPKAGMCQGCHGSNLQGRGGFPSLAGQQAVYLKKQLLNFKNRSRKGGPMNAITTSLSEQDINEISAYLGSL